MSAGRIASNYDAFVRDLVRDYCAVYLALADQCARFRREKTVSFAVLNALLGKADSKGVFWRLKDTSHSLFRQSVSMATAVDGEDPEASSGAFLDWCIGYAFHECCKLREDAFQGIHYASRLTQLSRTGAAASKMAVTLGPLVRETVESSRRELERILHVLRSGMQIMNGLLPKASENVCLARWLAVEEAQARQAFGHLYPTIIRSLYGSTPERMYTLAASDLLDCGRFERSRKLLLEAKARGRIDADGESLLISLENASKPLKP